MRETSEPSPGTSTSSAGRYFEPRTPFAWLVPIGFLAFDSRAMSRTTWPMWTLLPAAAVFLLLVRPLTDHHLVLLLGRMRDLGRPQPRARDRAASRRIPQVLVRLRALVLFVAAGLYQEQRRLHRNDLSRARPR